jgi:hypothetical protein
VNKAAGELDRRRRGFPLAKFLDELGDHVTLKRFLWRGRVGPKTREKPPREVARLLAEPDTAHDGPSVARQRTDRRSGQELHARFPLGSDFCQGFALPVNAPH